MLLWLIGCPRDEEPPAPPPVTPPTTTAPSWCETEGFGGATPWDAVGPYGRHRRDLAEDFTVPLDDGSDWTLSERWTGCETLVFVSDAIARSEADPTPAWTGDLAGLVDRSPDNVHYFFVTTASGSDADAAVAAVAAERDQVVRDLGKKQAEWWGERLHVVAKPANRIGWVGEQLESPIGAGAFAIDRRQRVRGVGSLADVARYDPSLSWPWENNLAYLAHDVAAYEVEAASRDALAPDATVVPWLTGEVVEQLVEGDVELPPLDRYDTLEIEVEMGCPDPELGEFGNCGAWDYLAGLSVQGDDGEWIELARFITTYHREARWVVDASPMLPLLQPGGTRRLKWEWAPYWNVQPTATTLSLRLSDRGTGRVPATATRVATGGPFGSAYNDGRTPVDVALPADTVAAELVVIVTGHGAGTGTCAEFCDHQHEFTVGGSVYTVEFPEAGTDAGCAEAGVERQMTPNQWGTWWFGRGGWCPGQPVVPAVFDVTADGTPGSPLSVAYRGLYRDDTPLDGSGDILLNAWLVTYRAAP